MKRVERIPIVDEAFYWRCLIPCALRDRDRDRRRLTPEEIGTLHAAMVAHIDRVPLRVETYRGVERIAADRWGTAFRVSERDAPKRGAVTLGHESTCENPQAMNSLGFSGILW